MSAKVRVYRLSPTFWLCFLYGTISIFNMHAYLPSGRFWAEEGTFFLNSIHDLPGVQGLTYIYHGHLELVTKICTTRDDTPISTHSVHSIFSSYPIPRYSENHSNEFSCSDGDFRANATEFRSMGKLHQSPLSLFSLSSSDRCHPNFKKLSSLDYERTLTILWTQWNSRQFSHPSFYFQCSSNAPKREDNSNSHIGFYWRIAISITHYESFLSWAQNYFI